MTASASDLLRSLPSVGSLLEFEEVKEWLAGLPRGAVVAALQQAVEERRQGVLAGRVTEPVAVHDVLTRAEELLVEQSIPSLRRVINATGVVLHTGLGRAPLCDAAIEAIVEAARGYCNVEYDLATGERGHRASHVAGLLCRLTGAEAATVVNNNAAATVLILGTFAAGREVVVSRGQLIEIGGSFRLPEIMAASGATLKEVGTTNRTRLSDYERAIGPHTGLVLYVHTSNYRVVGFTESPGIKELTTAAHRRGARLLADLGSGALVDLAGRGLPHEPTVAEALAAGADLVCFSGDKLLGGPQCGIILCRKELLPYLESNPLMRAFRVDKLTLLALEATLRHYAEPEEAFLRVPALHMLTATADELADRARQLCEQLQAAAPAEAFFVCSDVTYAGGGSLPAHELPTVVVQWRPAELSAEEACAALRQAETPVVARVRNDAVCFDLRTLTADDFEEIAEAIQGICLEREEDEGDNGDRALPVL